MDSLAVVPEIYSSYQEAPEKVAGGGEWMGASGGTYNRPSVHILRDLSIFLPGNTGKNPIENLGSPRSSRFCRRHVVSGKSQHPRRR